MAIIWHTNKPKTGIATVTNMHITFNKNVGKYFDDVYAVRLGIDPKQKKIIIKLLSMDDALRGDVETDALSKVAIHASYERISNKEFLSTAGELLKHPFTKQGEKFEVMYDENDKLIMIDLERRVLNDN